MFHFPISLKIAGHPILLHVIFELLGFFVGYRYYLYLKKKQGDALSTENRLWIVVGTIFGALVGSRLVGGLENPMALLQAPNKWYYFYQNKTLVGGLLGGLWGVELIKKIIGETQKSGDLFVFPLLLGMILGRIGCFSMGIHEPTFGLPTDSFLGLDLGDGILRHPVALYEIVFLLILWVSLKKAPSFFLLRSGDLFKGFMVSYLLFRFCLDFIKPHANIVLFLSTIQLFCLIGLLYYAYLHFRLHVRHLENV